MQWASETKLPLGDAKGRQKLCVDVYAAKTPIGFARFEKLCLKVRDLLLPDGYATVFVGRRLVFVVSRSGVCYSVVSATGTGDPLKPTLHSMDAGRSHVRPFSRSADPVDLYA